MVFGFLRRFRKEKEEEEAGFPTEVTTSLPDDLERFRTREPEQIPKPMDFVGQTERGIESKDKMDLILQKLETIDVRLKLLEEKLGV